MIEKQNIDVHTIELSLHLDYGTANRIEKIMKPNRQKGKLSYYKDTDEGIHYKKYLYNNRLIIIVNIETAIELLQINNIDYKIQCNEIEKHVRKNIRKVFDFYPFKHFVFSRIDYKFDCVLDEELRNLYMKLLKKGYFRYKHMKQVAYIETSRYLKNKSVTINAYDKIIERINKGKFEDLKDSEFIRLELQVKRNKIRYIEQTKDIAGTLKNYFDPIARQWFFENYLKDFIMSGNHYTLYEANKIINKNYTESMSVKLYGFLVSISRRGIEKVKVKMNYSTFSNYKKRLENIGVNPITIPRHVTKLKVLPNLYDVYKNDISSYNTTYAS